MFGLAAALVLAACGGAAPSLAPTLAPTPVPTPTPAPTAEAYTITGTLRLIDSDLGESGTVCWGRNGYDDISAGADVVVRDEAGVILAASSLGAGKLSEFVRCTFEFEVAGVPRAAFYEIEVSHRGGLTYSFADMVSRDWTVGFSLD